MTPLEATLPAPGEEQGQEVVVAEQHEVAPAGDPILAAILAAARDPQVDIAKIRELKAMYNEERDYHAEQEFNRAMQAAQAEMGPVARDRSNDQTNSNYATIEAIAAAITPIYTKHGFSMSFGQGDTDRAGHLRVTGTLKHNGGWSTDHFADVPIDATGMKGSKNKTDTHAFGSTMSYGRRYLKLLVWDIATKDDDGNAAGSGAAITQDEAATITARIEEVGADEAAFCSYMGVEKITDLPAKQFARAMQALGAKARQAEAKQKAEASA